MSLVKELGVKAAKSGLGRPLLRVGAARNRALVMCYHRVGPREAWQVVPGLPVGRFREQVHALAEVADIVPLAAAHESKGMGTGSKPRVAITFDDDYTCHLTAASVLADLGAQATFFLSGRVGSGLGPYWWQVLEGHIRSRGLASVADDYGLVCDTPAGLAAELAGTEAASDLERGVGTPGAAAIGIDPIETDLLDEAGIAELVAGGFDIGFHTARHQLLPSLDDERLAAALNEGRAELETLVGRRLTDIAYPHGQADERVAAASALAFDRGWTGSGHAIGPGSTAMRFGRWEPGPLEGRRLQHEVALRLNRRV